MPGKKVIIPCLFLVFVLVLFCGTTTARTTNDPDQAAMWISAKNFRTTYSPTDTVKFTVTTTKNIDQFTMWVFKQTGKAVAYFKPVKVKKTGTSDTINTEISLLKTTTSKPGRYYVIFQEPGYDKKFDLVMTSKGTKVYLDSTATSKVQDFYPNWQIMTGKSLYTIIKNEIQNNSGDSCTSLEFEVKK